jgi:hypothetical protein
MASVNFVSKYSIDAAVAQPKSGVGRLIFSECLGIGLPTPSLIANTLQAA